jgi:hypothetical protein
MDPEARSVHELECKAEWSLAWPTIGCYECALALTLSVKMLVALPNLYKEAVRSSEIVVQSLRQMS